MPSAQQANAPDRSSSQPPVDQDGTVTMDHNSHLEELMYPALEVIDEYLAQAGLPVFRRPLDAATLYVQDFVIEVKGGSKDKFLTEMWFAEFVRLSTRWYEKRYGAELLKYSDSGVPAVVLIHSTPFEFNVPIAPTTPGQRSGTAVIHFISDLLPEEDPMAWFVSPPAFESLSESEMEAIRTLAVQNATLTRGVFNALMTSEFPKEAQSLPATVRVHLTSGVQGLSSMRREALSTAVWDFHLAVEKTLKLYLIQKGVAPPPIHNLQKLHRTALDHGFPGNRTLELDKMPNDNVAIKHRYAEIPSPTILELYEIYESALNIMKAYSLELSQGWVKNHATITVQALPWHPSQRLTGEDNSVNKSHKLTE